MASILAPLKMGRMIPDGAFGGKRKPHFIKEWRKHRNLTQEALAEKIDLTASAISQLENGVTNYTQPTLEAIARILSTTPANLLGHHPASAERRLRGDGEIRTLLQAIDKVGPREAGILLSVIKGFWREAFDISGQTQTDAQSAPASRPREPASSRKR